MALEYGVEKLVVDNLMELDLVNEIAGQLGITAKILLRLTPGIDATPTTSSKPAKSTPSSA